MPRKRRTTTGWRESSSRSLIVGVSSPPPLSTCYQTDHQPCRGTSEELTTQHNQEKQSIVCVIPPTPLRESGESGRTGSGRPSLLTQQAGTHPPFPATWPHDHPAGPATTTWEPPDHQVPPESLKQGQELAIPTSAAVAVSAPVMTLAHSGGGETETWWVRPTTGTGTLTCANTKHLLASPAHLHTPTTTMPTPLTLAEPRLPWELFLLQVPR